MKDISLIITGPSGAGKGTLIKHLQETFPGVFTVSVSATTRPPREGEVDGVHYHFVSLQQFQEWADEGKFLEYNSYADHLYGTPRTMIANTIFEVETHGATEIMHHLPSAISIFIMPPEPWRRVLSQRLRKRGMTPKSLETRLKTAEFEIKESFRFKHLIVNDDLDRAKAALVAIVTHALEDAAA